MQQQGDLQDWLSQLKKRSGASTPADNKTNTSSQKVTQHNQSRPTKKRSVHRFEPELVDTSRNNTMEKSATDIALERIRNQEQEAKLERRREAIARKRNVEKKLRRQKEQEKINKSVRSLSRNNSQPNKQNARPNKQSSIPNQFDEIKNIHYRLRSNPSAMREALILSEIIMPPIALRGEPRA